MARKSNMDAHLLVEGKNDLHVISALCKKHRVTQAMLNAINTQTEYDLLLLIKSFCTYRILAFC